jgi:hypothetical protein
MTTTFEIWPAERTDIILTVPQPRRAMCAQRVVELLAAVDGVSVEDYLASIRPDLAAIRALAAYGEDAVLAAAWAAPELTPVSVLSVISSQHALAHVA